MIDYGKRKKFCGTQTPLGSLDFNLLLEEIVKSCSGFKKNEFYISDSLENKITFFCKTRKGTKKPLKKNSKSFLK